MKTEKVLLARLKRLEKMRQDFVANVSHELRTPLTVMHGYLEALLEKFKAQPEMKKIFVQMMQQSLRMERLIEDLLMLSHLENDALENKSLQVIDATKLIQAIVKDAKALGKRKHQKFTLELDPSLNILGAENELHSAFSNLIFNAVHYTPAKGKIHIRWFSDKRNAYFEIKDTGIGIAPEHLSRITERFYRADRDRSRKSGGTGLGLAIVKHILIRHHAKLKIESVLHEGSSFICIFPKTQKRHTNSSKCSYKND